MPKAQHLQIETVRRAPHCCSGFETGLEPDRPTLYRSRSVSLRARCHRGLRRSRPTRGAISAPRNVDLESSSAHLCDHDVLLLFSALCDECAFERMRQGQPYKIPTNKVTVRLRKATSKWDQVFVDSADHLPVSFSVSWLQCVVYMALQFPRF
jgi:hypothetical protein